MLRATVTSFARTAVLSRFKDVSAFSAVWARPLRNRPSYTHYCLDSAGAE
jgi:hypothetical protein